MKNLVIIVLFLSLSGFSQEDKFWTNTFNTEASMLAGAVVGGNSDITSLYYNPAGISEIEEKKIVLNTNLFRLDKETYKNILGKKQSIEDWGFRVQPRFISYIYRSKKIRNLSWQIAFFTKISDYKSLTSYNKQSSNTHYKNIEETTNSYDYFNEYNNYCGSIGTSYQITEKLSIGIGVFATVKNLLYSIYQYSITRPNTITVPDSLNNYNVITDSYERINLYDVRLLSKIGVRYKFKTISVGLNITTPSVKIFGNGDVKHRISNTYYTDSTIINSFQDEDSKYRVDQIKNPFSIALGIVYYLNEKNTQIYFTSEFFNKIPTYLIINGTQVIRSEQDNYDKGTSFSSYKYGTKSIINYAVGFKQVLSSNFDLMLGFRTDFNAYEVSSEGSFKDINEIQNIHSDLFHFTVGSNFNYKKTQFILGFQYTYGKQDNTKNDINTENNSVYDTAGINNKDMVYTLNSLGLFLGFSLKF